MALRGDISKISQLKSRLRELPTTVAADVAARAAPAMTALTTEAHAARRGVYGTPYKGGVSLERTGAMGRALSFRADGRIVRCVLGPRDKRGTQYGKYLIGRYQILPNGALPAEWSRRLGEIVASAKVPL